MPFIKISGLTTATAVSATNQFEINQNGASRSATVEQVATYTRGTALDTVVLAAGSAGAPALIPTGDTNTGIFFPTADTIAFSEGGVESMRIDSSARVGINTASPTAPLDVNGTVAITGTGRRITADFSNATPANRLAIQTNVANSNTNVPLLPNGTGTASSLQAYNSSDIANAGNFVLSISTAEARLSSGITGTGSYQPMTVYTGGSERMRIDTSGNVGIGNPSPTGKLDLYTNAATPVTINTGNSVNIWATGVDSSGNYSFYSNGVYNIIFSNSALERMRIDTNGNVGIGTSSPVNKLQVVGSFGRGAPVTKTGNFTLADTENWIICNGAGSITVTFPAASSWTGREVMIKTIAAQTVVSNASNVVPINSATAGTAILPATAGAWSTLVSNGTNWVIMQRGT